MSTLYDGDLPLGKPSSYFSAYAPDLLRAIPRHLARDALGLNRANLPFFGEDIWNAYELSWLNPKGKPEVACAEFRFPCESPAIIESKSLKLYLNSFNQSVFDSVDQLLKTIKQDFSDCVGHPVIVNIMQVEYSVNAGYNQLTGSCLDQLDVTIDEYNPDPALLIQEKLVVKEQLYSHLLRSLCPVTGQPDWGTLIIEYTGPKINHEGLLKYIIGYREHQEFHENCVERIYRDIADCCEIEQLSVYARYVRRGGVNINPYRCSNREKCQNVRLNRQ